MTALAIGEPSLGGQINEIRVGGYDVDLDPGEPESSSASASSAPATRTMRGSRMPVGATKRTGPAPDESLERGGVRFVATETIAEASITECHARSSHQSLVAAGIERPGMSMRRSVRSDLMDGGGFAHSLAASEFVGKATFVGLDVEGQAGRIVYFCDAFYPHRCWARKIM